MISLKIKKLFGRFDYDVILKSEGLTILTGPNGYGKSTILKCIDALGKEMIGIMFFFALDFKSLVVELEDNSVVEIKKTGDNLTINGIRVQGKTFKENVANRLERRPYMRKISDDTWLDMRRGERINYNDFLARCYIDDISDIDTIDMDNGIIKKIIPEMKNIKNSLGDIYFIKEQRLIREVRRQREEQEVLNVIEELPDKFKTLMGQVMSNYSTVANRLDSTYPHRLFLNEDAISEIEYHEKVETMNKRFEKINKYDLSTMQNLGNVLFKDEHAKALKIYFDDFDIKYKEYDDFINKLDMYTDIINDRLSFKEIKISRKEGISVIDKENEKKDLNLSQLSSGEKQEIVLFYQLIFETSNNILLLIDEPEISLHITWQKRFMDDLMKIIQYKNMNVIVATHSPQIINNHWDYQIDLGEIYAEQFNKEQLN